MFDCEALARELEKYNDLDYVYLDGYGVIDASEIEVITINREDFYKIGNELISVNLEEPLYIGALLDEFYDIKFEIEDDEITSVSVCLGVGGPSIWVDTKEKAVLSYWWGSTGRAPLSDSVCNAIIDWADAWRFLADSEN